MVAHVLDGLVELLEAVGDGARLLDGQHGLLQLAPCHLLVVLRQLRTFWKIGPHLLFKIVYFGEICEEGDDIGPMEWIIGHVGFSGDD